MALFLSLILVATVAASALHSFGLYRGCPRSDTIQGRGAAEGKTCGIATNHPALYPPASVVNPQGGYQAVPHSFPWIVSIQFRDYIKGSNWIHVCPGTLVSKKVVKTNGYCQHASAYSVLGAQTPFNWLIVLGVHDSSVLANVNTSVVADGNWNGPTINLVDDFMDSPYINNICVGKLTFPVGYSDCVTTGWYTTETSYTDLGLVGNSNLSQANLQIISMDEYTRETGHAGDPNNYIFTVVTSPGGFPAWRSMGQPLMCRYWCEGGKGQWHLLGFADSYVIRKGLSNGKTYALFNKYVPE